jgi:O-6-methylguanine DNA methyltransferase
MEIYSKKGNGVWFGVAYDGEKIAASTFRGSEAQVLSSLEEILPNLPLTASSEPNEFAQKALSIMQNIYEGKDVDEKVPLSVERLPSYTRRVLGAVCQIPVGYVASYGGVAEAVGGGARAVGNAMANNPFAPLVPCHRVVTSNLGLGGYGGGLGAKFEFLKREKRGYTQPQQVLAENGSLNVFPVEFVLRKLEGFVPKEQQIRHYTSRL